MNEPNMNISFNFAKVQIVFHIKLVFCIKLVCIKLVFCIKQEQPEWFHS